MEISPMIYLFSNVIGMIFLFWIVLNSMIKDKKILIYMPFYVIAIFLFLSTIITFFEISEQRYWVFIGMGIGISLINVFLKIRGMKHE